MYPAVTFSRSLLISARYPNRIRPPQLPPQEPSRDLFALRVPSTPEREPSGSERVLLLADAVRRVSGPRRGTTRVGSRAVVMTVRYDDRDRAGVRLLGRARWLAVVPRRGISARSELPTGPLVGLRPHVREWIAVLVRCEDRVRRAMSPRLERRPDAADVGRDVVAGRARGRR